MDRQGYELRDGEDREDTNGLHDEARERGSRFDIFPLVLSESRSFVYNKIIHELIAHETVFTDYNKACSDRCMECSDCARAIRAVTNALIHPDAMVWEVWSTGDTVDLTGILYITDVVVGCDAKAHYAFFDNDLWGKTDVIKSVIDWLFEDHPEWVALSRLTIEIPDFAFALAAHATRKLGFGGDNEYTTRKKSGKKSRTIPVEGVKRNALLWRDMYRDVLVLGLLNQRIN